MRPPDDAEKADAYVTAIKAALDGVNNTLADLLDDSDRKGEFDVAIAADVVNHALQQLTTIGRLIESTKAFGKVLPCAGICTERITIQ